MISEARARQTVLDLLQPLEAISLPLGKALGSSSAASLHATVPIPGFDNSMMDGYALVAADSKTASPLRVIGEQPAGPDLGLTLKSGETIRIFTGAPMPGGADSVIMQEDVDRADDNVSCREPVEPGENVRREGSDLCAGQKILSQGERLTAAKLALLAAQGHTGISVHRKPRVAVLSTGDELVAPGSKEQLEPGEIFNSNGLMLASMCRECGVEDVEVLHCRDSLQSMVATLTTILAKVDLLLISGGVSVGDHDHVRPALQQLGIQPELWRVRVKPGKPFLFARSASAGILGLPGNPVSSFVTFHLFVKPAIRRLCGASVGEAHPSLEEMEVSSTVFNDGNRPHYLRGRIEGGAFTPQGLQQSHALATLARANGLLRLEAGVQLDAGEKGPILRI